MKKFTAFLLVASMTLALTACGGKKQENQIGMPNPFVEYEKIEEAESAAGFEIEAPGALTGFSEYNLSVMDDKMIQIIYSNDDDSIYVRKSAVESEPEDISGDYNKYKESQDVDCGDFTVHMEGNDSKVMKATWTAGDYNYSVTSNAGVEINAMCQIVDQLK